MLLDPVASNLLHLLKKSQMLKQLQLSEVNDIHCKCRTFQNYMSEKMEILTVAC